MTGLAIARRLHDEGEIVGLRFLRGALPITRYLRIETAERPNNLSEFSLGSASAQNTTGTGWLQIQDSNNNFFLQPDYRYIMYQIYYGVGPSYARVYRRYPAGVDRGSLFGTRLIGSQVGWVDGLISPLHRPSVQTEFYTVNGQYPSFNGYHPYGAPASITVFMSFYISAYSVAKVKAEDLTDEEKKGVKLVTMGGRTLMQAPDWLQDETSERGG